jgi:CheY-like chemotaxis protein
METEHSPHVLLIDDNVEVSHMYSRAFRTHGCETRALYDAETALKELQEGDFVPDIIVLDMMMPRMNGAEFLAELRKDARFEKIPTVVLTNARDDEYANQLADIHIDLYLNKLDHELSDVVEQVVKIVKQ